MLFSSRYQYLCFSPANFKKNKKNVKKKNKLFTFTSALIQVEILWYFLYVQYPVTGKLFCPITKISQNLPRTLNYFDYSKVCNKLNSSGDPRISAHIKLLGTQTDSNRWLISIIQPMYHCYFLEGYELTDIVGYEKEMLRNDYRPKILWSK